jgi:hypothetical protein
LDSVASLSKVSGVEVHLTYSTTECGTVGRGELFAASNSGGLEFVDYDKTGLTGAASNFSAERFLPTDLDDIAPLAPPGVSESGSIVLLGTVLLGLAGGAKKVMRRHSKSLV